MSNPLAGGSDSSGGSSESWQNKTNDKVHRKEMVQQIVKVLKKDINGSSDLANRVPQMAKQLEVALYRQATSLEVYLDMSTLNKRLKKIAVTLYKLYQSRNLTDEMVKTAVSQEGSDQRQQSAAETNVEVKRPTTSDSITTATAPEAKVVTASLFHIRSNPGWRVRIHHKQQRLLLLHHSAKCLHENGHCTITPHCADMKHLWQHMEGCKDNGCRVAHCFLSRDILDHYRECKDLTCPVCGPIRETIRQLDDAPSANSSIQSPAAARELLSQQQVLQSPPTPPQPPQQQLPDPLLVSNSFNSTTLSTGGSDVSSLHNLGSSGRLFIEPLDAADSCPSSSQQCQQSINGMAPSAGSLSSAQTLPTQNNSSIDLRMRPLPVLPQHSPAALSFQPMLSLSNVVGSNNGALSKQRDLKVKYICGEIQNIIKKRK